MESLDSRSLRYVDCYAQKFSTPGTYYYQISRGLGLCLGPDKENAFSISVKARNGRMAAQGRQHNIAVVPRGNGLSAEPAHIEIEVGDTVMWHASDTSLTGYVVRGEGEGQVFDSSALSNDAVYTHAFGLPGEYKWVDAQHGRVGGIIIVRSPEATSSDHCREWLAALSQGAAVVIEGDQVKPGRVEILTGQTVFWAVRKADGISITDVRLV